MILEAKVTLTPEMEKQLEAAGWKKPQPASAYIEDMQTAFQHWYTFAYNNGWFSGDQQGSAYSWLFIEKNLPRIEL